MPQNQPKKLKFHGEESFMCKRGRTKKRYLMLTAEPNVAKMQEAVDVMPLEPTTVLNPSEVSQDVVQTTMTPPVLISVPNWEAMSCKEILLEIQSIQDMLATSNFSEDVVNQYNQIVSEGKAVYTKKCAVVSSGDEITPHAPPQLEVPLGPTGGVRTAVSVSPTPTFTPTQVATTTPTTSTTTITTSGTPIIQTTGAMSGIKPPVGGVGGGGGGGAKQEEKKKSNWIWIVIVLGGAYLLFRRK